jgi:hypothetical protein
MFNRVKELLAREGLISTKSSEDEVRTAVSHWVDMMAEASREGRTLAH